MPRRHVKNLSIGLVFDDTLDSNDGVAQYVKILGSWLSSQGHKVSYLVGESKTDSWGGAPVYSLSKNIIVRWGGNRLSMPLLANHRRIKRLLAGRNLDILHVMVPYSPLMAQRVISSTTPGTAVVGTFHIYPAGKASILGSRLLRLVYGRSLRRFSEVVSVSSAAASFARSAYGLETRVIPNPVDVARFRVKPGFAKSGELKIVFLGRLVKRKGCRQLIEAFKLLAPELPNARLVIAGSGAQRQELTKLVQHYGLDDKVEFLGYVEEADKPKLLASADVACFPSLYGESFGIVLIEAMAAGAKVVLGGDNPGYHSVLEAQPKLLVDPRDPALFAARLKELLSDKALQEQLYTWQQTAVRQYDINVVGGLILSVYQTAIARLHKNGDNNRYG